MLYVDMLNSIKKSNTSAKDYCFDDENDPVSLLYVKLFCTAYK